MSPVTQKNTVNQPTVRARKKAILEWEDPEPIPEPEPQTEPESESDMVFDYSSMSWMHVEDYEFYKGNQEADTQTDHEEESEGEDFWDDWDIETDLMICKLHEREMDNILKSIKRDALKFEHYLMIRGLKDIAKIEASIKPKPKPKPAPKVEPTPKPTKNPFDNFWKFKVKPNDKTPVCKWKGNRLTNKSRASTQTVLTPGSPPG